MKEGLPMAENEQYWRGRFSILEEAARRDAKKRVEELETIYRDAERRVQADLERWYGWFASNNGISLTDARKMLTSGQMEEFRWTVEQYIKAGQHANLSSEWLKKLENASARFRVSRLETIQLQIQQQMELLYGGQLDSLDRLLRKVISNGYTHTAFEIQKGLGLGWDITALNQQKLETLLSKPWTADGKTFRDRCWENKANLVSGVQSTLTQGILRGDSLQKITDNIKKQFGISRYKACRLAYTETTYFNGAANLEVYRDLGVEQIEILETLDQHTCEVCGALDGKVIPLSQYEPGVTVPPFHPNCRGTTCPHYEDMAGERAARKADGEVYHIPDDMTYEEWKKGFMEGEKSDIMRSIHKEPQPITTQSIQNVGLVHSELLGERESRALQNANKRLLMEASRQPLGTEVGAVYTMDMKQVGKHIVGEINGVSIPRQEFDYIVLHNHPDCGTFSFGDLEGFARRDNLKIMIAVGNNGSVYLVEKTTGYNGTPFMKKVKQMEGEDEWKASPQKAHEIIDTFLQEVNVYGVSYRKIER